MDCPFCVMWSFVSNLRLKPQRIKGRHNQKTFYQDSPSLLSIHTSDSVVEQIYVCVPVYSLNWCKKLTSTRQCFQFCSYRNKELISDSMLTVLTVIVHRSRLIQPGSDAKSDTGPGLCPTLGISCPPPSFHCFLIISKMLFGASANIPSTILHFIKIFSIILAALSPCQVLFAGRLLSHVPVSAVSTISVLVSLYGSVSAVLCCKQQQP